MSSIKTQPKTRGANIKLLNPQQQMFVRYLAASEDFNMTEAARNAGYKSPSKSSLDQMRNPIVRAAIGKVLAQRLDRIEMDADEVLKQLSTALFLDPLHLFEEVEGKWQLRSIDTIPAHIRRCITKYKVKSVYNDEGKLSATYLETEFMSKDAALALAMKHFGIAGVNEKGDQPSEALETMRLLSTLLSKVEERSQSNVIDSKFIENKVIEVPKS